MDEVGVGGMICIPTGGGEDTAAATAVGRVRGNLVVNIASREVGKGNLYSGRRDTSKITGLISRAGFRASAGQKGKCEHRHLPG